MLPVVILGAAALGALGGARPTGLGAMDAVLLGAGGAAAALAATQARSIPLYVACAAAALLQPATVPLVLGAAAMVCVLARRHRRAGTPVAAAAGGLTWAAAVGAPFHPGASPLIVPMLAIGVMLVSARLNAGKTFRHRFDLAALTIAGAFVVAGCLAVGPVLGARGPLERGTTLLRSGLAAARAGDTNGALNDLQAARRAFERGHDSVLSPLVRPALALPGLSQNVRALQRASGVVRDLTAVGIDAAAHADVGTLRPRGGRVDLAAVRAMEQPLARVVQQLVTAQRTVADLRGQAILPQLRHQLDSARDEITKAQPSADLALEAVRAAPGLLGGNGPRRYLVLFTTPSEARATTGFPGNFGELTFDDGRFALTQFGRADDLTAKLPAGGAVLTGVADYANRYGRFGVTRDWRNITMSPDFPTVASVAGQLYHQTGAAPVDGVLSVDPTALAALLHLTGPVTVPGVATPLGADNAAQYLDLGQYVELTNVNQRVDVLAQLAKRTLDKLTGSDLPGPRELGDLFSPVVHGKHLQLASFDAQAEHLFDRMGISGRYPTGQGDFVGVTTTNAGGNKIDVFLQRRLGYSATWDPATGALDATATITLTNTAPASGLPDYVIGNALGARVGETHLPRGTNTSFVTLYTPWGSTGATLDGQPLVLQREDELGRLALSTRVSIPPGGTRTLVVHLQGRLAATAYRLDLAAQPLVVPEQAVVEVTVAGGHPVAATGLTAGGGATASGAFPLVSDTSVFVRRQ